MRKVQLLSAAVSFLAVGIVAAVVLDVGKCPISGRPAKEGSSLNVNGEAVYFCCDNCPKAYEKKLKVTDKGADKCPISGAPAKAETRLLHKTAEMVYFCCANCPKAYAKKNNIELKDDAKPGKCPISGKDANADSFLVVDGEKVFFCCDNCPKAYVKKNGIKDEGAKKCAVSGEEADENSKMVVTKTNAVYFCCNNCPKSYAKKHFKTASK